MLVPSMRITRRQFLAAAAGGLAAVPTSYLYARHVEPGWLATRRHRLPLPDLDREIRIAHVSDLHASPEVPDRFLRRAVEQTLAEAPDLICVTGDFVTRELADPAGYRDLLKPLAAAAPTYACLGNHDGGAWAGPWGGYPDTQAVRRLLRQAGMILLHNQAAHVQVRGQTLQLAGVGDLWSEELDASMAFLGVDRSLPTVVLAHNPDSKKHLADKPWSLMLSGHTHGGQLALPVLGTPFAPVRDHAYVHGLNPWRDRWIHTTSGVGNLHGFRFNCRPEVAILTLGGSA